jgi:hypothetical protein
MHTLEGPVTYGFGETTISRYTLHFRNGILEGVTDCAADIQTRSIPLTAVEATIARAVSDHLKYWNQRGIGPPYFLFITILLVEGYLGNSQSTWSTWSEEGVRVKRGHLLLPSQVITQSEGIDNIGTLLRPTFDLLWNGFGYTGSVNFDEHGRYRLYGH